MKTFFSILFAVALVFIVTKPADQECIYQAQHCREYGLLEHLAAGFMLNEYTLQVNDRLFYKEVTSSLTGEHVAYAYLGKVVVK